MGGWVSGWITSHRGVLTTPPGLLSTSLFWCLPFVGSQFVLVLTGHIRGGVTLERSVVVVGGEGAS